jgi:hypothetical protein
MWTTVLVTANAYRGVTKAVTASATQLQHVAEPMRGAARFMRSLLVAATCICGGCAMDRSENSTEPVPTAQAAEPLSRAPATLQAAAVDDAARRSGKPRDAVKIVAAEAVTWSDGSLGCPEPGVLYTQALVRGYRIMVEVADQQLEYHAGKQGPPKFCPPDRVVAPAPDDRI